MQTETQNYQDIRTQIQHFSDKLLDLSMRNSLLNFKHSEKANNQISLLDEDLDKVFLNLLAGDEFYLKPVADTNENEPDLNITVHRPDFKPLQTSLDKNALQKRVRALRRLIKSDFEEKGCNTFYMAFGFLKWCEHESVETPQNTHEAPLLLIKLSLLTDDKKGTFTVSDAGDGVTFNLSLAKKLLEFGIELPNYEDGVTPIQYFHQVQKLIKDKPLWTIEKKLTIGRFIFSRLAMYEDLDIEKNWPHLSELFEQNPALKQLFLSKELPVAAKTYDIDKDTDVETYAPFLVTDADSSQHSAITDVLKGKSLVIKGPPGTGKSQTITNMIANALLQNKKVLFISQKKAALDVVYQRLSKIGLKDFCLELHSDKTSLKNIKSDLANSYDKYCRGNYEIFNDEPVFSSDYDPIKDLKHSKLNIRKYYDALNEKVGAINSPLFDAIWLENEYSQALKEVTPAVKNIKIDQALSISSDELDEITILLERLNQSFQNKAIKEGINQKFIFKDLTRPDVQELFERVEELSYKIKTQKETFQKICADNHININESLLSYKELFEFLNQLLEDLKQDKINLELLSLLKEEPLKTKVFALEKLVTEYQRQKKYFETDVLNLNALIENETHIKSDAEILTPLLTALQDKTIHSFVQWVEQFKNLLFFLKLNAPVFEKAHLSLYQTKEGTKHSFSFLVELLKTLSLLSNRGKSFLKNGFQLFDKNKVLVEELLLSYQKIKEKENNISLYFDINQLLLNKDEMPQVLHMFETKNAFSFLNNGFRKAKKTYESCLKSENINPVSALKEANAYLKMRLDFETNVHFKSVLGANFDEIDTDVLALQNAFEGYTALNYAINLLDEKDKLIIKQLFMLSDDTIWQELIELSNKMSFDGWMDFPTDMMPKFFKIETLIEKCDNLQPILDRFSARLSTIFKGDILLTTMQTLLETAPIFISLQRQISDLMGDLKSTPLSLSDDYSFDEKTKLTLETLHALEGLNALTPAALLSVQSINGYEFVLNLNEKLNEIKQMHQLFDVMCSKIETKVTYLDNFNTHIPLNTLSIDALESAMKILTALKDEAYDFIVIDELKSKINQTKAGPFINALTDDLAMKTDLKKGFLALFYKSLLQEYQNTDWIKFTPNEFHLLQSKIIDLDKQSFDLFKERLIKSISLKIDKDSFLPEIVGNNSARFGYKTNLSLIKHQISTTAKNMPLRQFIERSGEALQLLKPCFLMSPISVAQYITSKSITFDLLIIDEASQMYFEEALGSLLRSRQFVVVGDEKQLPPTPFFQKLETQDETWQDDDFAIENNTSVLETMLIRGFDVRELLWHYRSKEDALINFSNKYFYKNNLNIFPSTTLPSFRKTTQTGIVLHQINGLYTNRCNEKEAEAIANAVLTFIKEKPNYTLGVATMNVAQAELIERKIDELKETHPEIKPFFTALEARHESFFVKNLENVQGDERDFIFISTVYGPESEGKKVSQNFGPINGKHGARRLNVLFTRARYGVDLFTSLSSSDIHQKDTTGEGLFVFKKYLEYAENGFLDLDEVTFKEPKNPFEKSLTAFLTESGYKTHLKVGMNNFYVDLAVINPKDETKYLLAIEMDATLNKALYSARDKECTRPVVLKMLGWHVYRIWSKDWFYNQAYEKEKLLTYLKELQ